MISGCGYLLWYHVTIFNCLHIHNNNYFTNIKSIFKVDCKMQGARTNCRGMGSTWQTGSVGLHMSARDAARSHQLRPAHQGVLGIGLRAEQSVYWPGFWSDIEETRSKCSTCQKIAPSQAKLPPMDTGAELPGSSTSVWTTCP